MKLWRRHRHEWGPWRFTLMTLTDSPVAEPPEEARHCGTCPAIEFRRMPRLSAGEQR